MKKDLLAALRNGEELTLRQQTTMALQLSIPAILAGEEKDARNLVKQSLLVGVAFGMVLAALSAALAGPLPRWLGAEESIWQGASVYFLIFALSLPALQINGLVAALLQASGNMRTPSALLVLMCGLDVVFNLLLIFPSRQIGAITLPGANLGVAGAALGHHRRDSPAGYGVHRRQLLRRHSGGSVLYAGLRRRNRSGDADRAERGRQAAGSGDAAGLGDGAAGCVHYGGDVGSHVLSGAVDHRYPQP